MSISRPIEFIKACEEASSSDGLQSPLFLIAQVVDLLLQCLDDPRGPFNGREKFASLPPPTADAFNLSRFPALFGIDPLAQLALLVDRDGLHDKLHPTGFARSVFAVAMLAEVSPLPVAALETMLVVEAHLGSF